MCDTKLLKGVLPLMALPKNKPKNKPKAKAAKATPRQKPQARARGRGRRHGSVSPRPSRVQGGVLDGGKPQEIKSKVSRR